MDNLDGFQKLVLTIEKSRSRFLDLVSTSMSRPKSLDGDWEFVEIWKFWRFSTVCLDLDREVHGFLYFLVEISRQISTISTKILTRQSLDWKVSILKILTKKKKVDLDMMYIRNGFQKLVSTRRTFSISIGLDVETTRLRIMTSKKWKKIWSHEKMNFDLMKFDLLTLSQSYLNLPPISKKTIGSKNSKVGGLDVETNRDRDRERPTCRDELF
jgi:hypothetical protein